MEADTSISLPPEAPVSVSLRTGRACSLVLVSTAGIITDTLLTFECCPKICHLRPQPTLPTQSSWHCMTVWDGRSPIPDIVMLCQLDDALGASWKLRSALLIELFLFGILILTLLF